VCCENYDKRNHIKIECGFCNHECCRECVQSYIMSRPDIPSCMNCNHEWTRQFLMEVCTKTFINKDYKVHRQQFLFDREQSRLPEAQQIIELQNQKRIFEQEIDGMHRIIAEKTRELTALQNRIESRDISSSNSHKFVRKCPLNECRGFLSTAWKCGVCEKHICSKCHEQKGENHECKPENVATTELLRKDTKPCPKCGVYITKIDGCDQMWCTDCHTAFSWRSGTIITGNIHNPHFFEARRVAGIQARNVNDVPCGGLPNHFEFERIGIKEMEFPRPLIPFVCYLEGLITNNREPDTMDLRIKYLKNEITEEKFKQLIQQRDKSYHKNREIDDIYRMVTTTLSDILRQIVTRDISDPEYAMNPIINILNYSNDAIKAVCKKYGSKANYLLYFKFYKRSMYGDSSRIRLTFNNKRMETLENFRGPNDFVFTRERLIAPYCRFGYVMNNY